MKRSVLFVFVSWMGACNSGGPLGGANPFTGKWGKDPAFKETWGPPKSEGSGPTVTRTGHNCTYDEIEFTPDSVRTKITLQGREIEEERPWRREGDRAIVFDPKTKKQTFWFQAKGDLLIGPSMECIRH